MENSTQNKKEWYVVYTRSRSEKKVYAELVNQNINCYLPLRKKLRRWKDRKKWVEMPLIPGYCFVHINDKDYYKVLRSDNIVCYVTFEGKAAIVQEKQIEQLKQMMRQSDFEISVLHENFEPGQKIEIIDGPLIGLKGELINCRGKNRFIIRIEQIKRIFSVEIPAGNLTFLPENSTIHESD